MIKHSKQRDGIRALLQSKDTHPTAEELFAEMKRDFPHLSLATVYRNLEQLAQRGEIMKIDVPGGPARYDGRMEQHFHLRCDRCGGIDDIFLDIDVGRYLDFRKTLPEYEIREVKIELSGLCKKCNATN